MALFLFTKAIVEGRAIDLFNEGRMQRDFTFIDDIVEGILRTLARTATPAIDFDAKSPDPARSNAPFRVFNIGNQGPVELMEFVAAIESALGVKAIKNLLPMQAGDVPATFADVSALTEWTGFKPGTTIASGVARFVAWYRDYYRV
jgi:UDP-glucuronate 4-epimerase